MHMHMYMCIHFRWWAPDNADVLVHFDSWDDLKYLVKNTDWEHQRTHIRKHMANHTAYTLDRWRQLLGVEKNESWGEVGR